MRIALSALAVATVLCACTPAPGPEKPVADTAGQDAARGTPRAREHAEFRIGMHRSELLARFGPPDSRQTLLKTSAPIWGPIEDFWPRVPDGARVEIWSYASTGSTGAGSDPARGSTELYFVDDSDVVDGIGFALEGVEYEAGPQRSSGRP